MTSFCACAKRCFRFLCIDQKLLRCGHLSIMAKESFPNGGHYRVLLYTVIIIIALQESMFPIYKCSCRATSRLFVFTLFQLLRTVEFGNGCNGIACSVGCMPCAKVINHLTIISCIAYIENNGLVLSLWNKIYVAMAKKRNLSIEEFMK